MGVRLWAVRLSLPRLDVYLWGEHRYSVRWGHAARKTLFQPTVHGQDLIRLNLNDGNTWLVSRKGKQVYFPLRANARWL